MTDTITTIPEALEAKRLAGRLWIMEALIERGQCPTPEGACSAAAAFLEAISDRIAAPVALKPGQYVCERCGQVAWGGDHVCPGAPAAKAVAEAVAGAYLAASQVCHDEAWPEDGTYPPHETAIQDAERATVEVCQSAILALTPAAATAALARIKAETRKAALRDAIGALKRAGLPDAALHVLALIDKEPAHG